MVDGIEVRRDNTLTFLPHRLNRQPVIVRGLTADELWITVSLSAAVGLVWGITLAVLVDSIPMVPTAIVLGCAAGLFFGGGLLRRHKRGRPETWLHRRLQCWMAQHIPALAAYVGANDLITRSGYWTTRRLRGR